MNGADRALLPLGAATAAVGVVLGVIGAQHPEPDPDRETAFLEVISTYDFWTTLHVIELSAILVTVVPFVVFAGALRSQRGAGLARLALGFALVGAAVASVWMMLDGVGMKHIADDWAAATGVEQATAFRVANAFEDTILALYSLVVVLWWGVPPVLFGLAFARSTLLPAWVGWWAVAGGLFSTVLGMIQLYTQRTALVTHELIPIALTVVSIWPAVVAVWLWLRLRATPGAAVAATRGASA